MSSLGKVDFRQDPIRGTEHHAARWMAGPAEHIPGNSRAMDRKKRHKQLHNWCMNSEYRRTGMYMRDSFVIVREKGGRVNQKTENK
jgi:hypothetical protein